MNQESKAIVIKKVKVSGADVLLTLYTRKLGKKKVYVKGARHAKSKFLSACQVLVEGDFSLFVRSSLSSIHSVSIRDSHSPIREDLEKFFVSSYMLELIDKFTKEAVPDSALYDFLSFALKCLEPEHPKNLKFFRMFYTLKLLQKSGLAPEVNFCTSCLCSDDLRYFSASSGGALCSACRKDYSDVLPLKKENAEFINLSLSHSYVAMRKHRALAYDFDELGRIIDSFLSEHVLNSSLKTLSTLRNMDL